MRAALTGGALGDAMGAPVEGRGPESILASFSDWNFTAFIPPQGWDGVSHYWKGNGRITDDTLMIEAFLNAYIKSGTHLDAYGYAEHILPEVTRSIVWVPEYQKDMAIWERLWGPEKYPLLRLQYANAEPRSAGAGNMVNCGVAMWIMPAGAMNAGDPDAAYQEAVLISQAHNESFAVEAAAVLAAAHAEAFGGGNIADVIAAALRLAKDGTRRACEAAVNAADPADDLPTFIRKVRNAVAPFDQRTEHTSDDKPFTATEKSIATDIGRPSRTMSIEEVPVALAALKYGDGDFLKTLRAGVCYGRDCDSIAGMACGLYGALFGNDTFPETLTRELKEANRRDFNQLADTFSATVRNVFTRDQQRHDARNKAMGA
ncbi:MAG: ADP-ribosylglycohydrolase family protein [Kiritimatiellae bacterium]|nr:ADP-ribosylglycohydrolase family protein [Kiritimatiellia bacterium]